MLINKKVSVDQCLCARVKHRSSFCLLWVRIQLETENFNFSKQKNGYIFVFCQSPTINIYFIFLRIAWRLLLYRWHWGAMRSSFLHILDSLLIKYDMTRPHIEYFHLAFFEYLGLCTSQKNRCPTQAFFFVPAKIILANKTSSTNKQRLSARCILRSNEQTKGLMW